MCFWPCPLPLLTIFVNLFFPTNNPKPKFKTSPFFVKLNLNRLRFLFCFHATFVLLWFRSICTFGTIVGGLQCRVGRTFSAGFGTGVRVGENVSNEKKNLQDGPLLDSWGPFFNGQKISCVSLVVKFHILVIFTPIPGEMIQIWRAYFSDGFWKTTN